MTKNGLSITKINFIEIFMCNFFHIWIANEKEWREEKKKGNEVNKSKKNLAN